ncbi:hypothetical protein HYH03_015517 [Edaphochlamys debaryana]|uniref:PI3K/PI4K catalytic domain-containing protein n=1 Tax=Edaphochlamys debaryana TaxID=47281 RepID=A0A835XL21_9CHLO|nr:hypothetical protein HYH03_015517 [Edaphochlamys debaryana]|eukprot:KAG2485806.1 hypothetical protein HYH03_015517 [Edaphochlamys debaryana]
MTPSGMAVVKMPCLPLPKHRGARMPGPCGPSAIVYVMQHLMALDKLSRECGFTDIIPRIWLAPVRGVVPGVGYPIDWWGLWMEYVEGISMENFLFRGRPRPIGRDTQIEIMNNKLNRTRVIHAAIFDLLTSQCDRHAQNIFIQEDGNIRLIDHDASLNHMSVTCGFDSVFVPTTAKYEVVRTANHWVLKLPGAETAPRLPAVDAQVLFDYRCYLPEGRDAMGTSYPPQAEACMRRIASMTPDQVKEYYGFTQTRVAFYLRTRAVDMLTKGYEWAAKYGQPRNANPRRYRMKPKCCELTLPKGPNPSIRCAHPYEPVWELPLGNPTTGKEWDKDRPDLGTYEGGTFPEDPPDAGLGGEGSAGWPPAPPAPPKKPRRPPRSPPRPQRPKASQ